jgi:undecaprenyl-diphosphatase
MRSPRQWAARTRSDVWFPVSLLTIAALLFVFGLIAQEVVEAEPLTFDRALMLALRNPADPSAPIGPPWLTETARDLTRLGSVVVLGLILIAVVGYLVLAGKRAAAWPMLGAVVGGVVLNDLLKFGFARPRPDIAVPAVRVFTSSFPSGHAALSAITYLTLGALLARTHSFPAIRIYFMSVAVVLTLLVGLSNGEGAEPEFRSGWR